MSLNHSHFPDWLANNWVFRKLFLFRKIFLSKTRSHHYGQQAEDVSIAKFVPKQKEGFFVDVGCFHPVKYNNTYSLYKRGWRGVNVDIDAIKIEGFNWVRKKDHNVCLAVSQEEGEITYWSNGIYTPTTTLDEDFAENRRKRGKKYQYIKKTTKSKPLTLILDESPFKDQKIDLLSIDVEGFDHDVLLSLDFEKYSPRLVVIESQMNRFSDIQKEDTYLFLTGKGYELVNWMGMSLLFLREHSSS
ncbi:MAG: FkbM family methyltransferase [Bacteroidota bacterium]